MAAVQPPSCASLQVQNQACMSAHGAGGQQSTAALRLAAALSACLAGAGLPGTPSNSSPDARAAGSGVILVACTSSVEEVPPPLRRCFTHEVAVDAPDQAARLRILQVQALCYLSI